MINQSSSHHFPFIVPNPMIIQESYYPITDNDHYYGFKQLVNQLIVISHCYPTTQWEFQDPKMEVLYHISAYFLGIFPYIGLI